MLCNEFVRCKKLEPSHPLPAESAIGTVTEEVPATRLAVNFSPISRIAPPPFGREMDGSEKEEEVSRAGVG